MEVPLIDLAAQEAAVTQDVLAAVARLAQGGRFVLGPPVEAFEAWLAETCGTSHAVGVASGTDSIELALRALGIGAGDAVVTPAFSFIAAAEAIAATGARPLFCDVDPATMNVSGDTVREAIKRARLAGIRVRAILPVHLFGLSAPIEELSALVREEGLALVEDAAQAIGARDAMGRPVGATSDAGCLSFFPTKNLGAWGDAGAVVTSSADVAERVRRLRSHGAVSPYVHAELGRNSRLDALQAAVLLAKVGHLAGWQRARERIATNYCRDLARLPLALPQRPKPPALHVWHAFVVHVAEKRDELAAWLRDRGIATRVYYPIPLHRQGCFEALDQPALPCADEACRTALALPMFATMSDAQQTRVVEQVAAFFDQRT